MKRIGILNFQYSNHNYGAVLQAAALEFMVRNMGYCAEHINFLPMSSPKGKESIYRRIINKVSRIINKVKCFIRAHEVEPRTVINNSEVFEEFRCEWLTRSNKTFVTKDELKLVSSLYDSVIVGSDQVWRPQFTGGNATTFFLSFIDLPCMRVSYAASFGVDYWEEYEDKALTEEVAEELHKFHKVSVREASGVSICKKTFDIEATHVVDPTLLAGRTFFDHIIKSSSRRGMDFSDIVYYKLDIDDNFLSFVQGLADKNEYSVENIYYEEINGELFYRPVAEWLEKISESKIVITDSFHCVCFAIIFEKQFVYYPNVERGMSRLESLLSGLGLLNQIITREDDDLVPQINYSEVNVKLEHLREESHDFLINALL